MNGETREGASGIENDPVSLRKELEDIERRMQEAARLRSAARISGDPQESASLGLRHQQDYDALLARRNEILKLILELEQKGAPDK